MTKEQLIMRLNVLLDRYEALTKAASRTQERSASPLVEAYCDGQFSVLVPLCSELEALILQSATNCPQKEEVQP